MTLYCPTCGHIHMPETYIKPGDTVKPGQSVGKVGGTIGRTHIRYSFPVKPEDDGSAR